MGTVTRSQLKGPRAGLGRGGLAPCRTPTRMHRRAGDPGCGARRLYSATWEAAFHWHPTGQLELRDATVQARGLLKHADATAARGPGLPVADCGFAQSTRAEAHHWQQWPSTTPEAPWAERAWDQLGASSA